MKWLRRLVVAFLLITVAVLGILNIWLWSAGKGKQYTKIAGLPHNRMGLLLGTAKYDTFDKEKVLAYYTYRVEAATRLFKAGKIDYIVVSSSNTPKEKNAETIRADLIAAGIPPGRILVDPFGLRTLDSILRYKELLDPDSVTIITQLHHGERALFLASAAGLEVVAFAAPGDYAEFAPGAFLHEQAARLVMLADIITHRHARYMAEKPIVRSR